MSADAKRFAVALSFPGELRARVERIADQLSAVFGRQRILYDSYHVAEFARPNLDVHLPGLYHDHSELIAVFLSADYERKEWPGLEWRAIRDLIKRRNDSTIMYLRSDDAPIPGVYSIDGYLDIRNHTDEEVTQHILNRVSLNGADASITKPIKDLHVCLSPRVFILPPRLGRQACVPVAESNWGASNAILILAPDDKSDEPFLNQLRRSNEEIIIAFQHKVCKGRIEHNNHTFKDGVSRWELRLGIETTSFLPMDVAISELTPTGIAEQRAQRVLLNQHPFDTNVNQLTNEGIKEIVMRGSAVIRTRESPFPKLYKEFRDRPRMFLEAAWITAVCMLKVTGIVEEVSNLTLTLNEERLHVEFSGQRDKYYGDPQTTIRVNGTCSLKPPTKQ